MPGADLTEAEVREAAAEAGISPAELRSALALRSGEAIAPSPSSSVMGPPRRGSSITHVEGRIPLPPNRALAAVRESIEQQTGKNGHHQGPTEVDIVHDDLGLTYRVRAAEDGTGNAIVRIDIDATSAKAVQRTLTGVGAGFATFVFCIGWLVSATSIWLTGLGFGAVAGLWAIRRIARLRSAAAHAQSISAQALLHAEDLGTGTPHALPSPQR